LTLVTIPLRPGVIKDDAEYAAEGAWVDMQLVRFRRGWPEKVGGWSKYVADQMAGKARGLYSWRDNAGNTYVAIGTHTNLYVVTQAVLSDITPAGFTEGYEYGTFDAGWGAGTWGHAEGWGSPAAVPTAFDPMSWSLAPWGQNLLACPRNGALYEWALNTGTPAATVSGAPSQIGTIFVTKERFVVAVGAHNGSNFDPMLIRWSDQEDNTSWSTSSTNLAGDFRLTGSIAVAGTQSRLFNLIWTDEGLYSMTYLGDVEFVFGFDTLGRNCGLIGPHAFVEKDGMAFWMSPTEQFFIYDGGSPRPLDCPVRKEVFDELVTGNQAAVYCGMNSRFNEVWWFYPTDPDSPELDKYVIYNWREDVWATGSLSRTSWLDAGATRYPLAVDADGYLYNHELGVDADGAAMTAFIETAPFDLGDGDLVMHISRLVPTMILNGSIDVRLTTRRWPQDVVEKTITKTFTPTSKTIDLHAEGRQAQLRFTQDAVGDWFRLGNQRADIEPGGEY